MPPRVVQLVTTISNNRGATRQTEQIIEAAKISAHSAAHNAAAAQSFSESASSINKNITDAVSKLNTQATQTEAIAMASKQSLAQARTQFAQDERPYMWIDDTRGTGRPEQEPLNAEEGWETLP